MRHYLEELAWKEIRKTVQEASPELFEIIEEINPSDDFPLVRACYPFGSLILNRNTFYLPTEQGSMAPIDDHRLPEGMRDQLNYSSFPLGIVAKNNIEVFREMKDQVFSLGFGGSGLELGVWEYLNWVTPYSVTAGARSLYMIPKITSFISHQKLKRMFGIKRPPPKKLRDHWYVFREVAQSNHFEEDWCTEVVFLTKKWKDAIKADRKWSRLNNYVLKKAWEHDSYSRKKSILDIIWQVFSHNLSARKVRIQPYIVDTLKHLVLIGIGAVPGSAASIGEDKEGPIKNIQFAYEEYYGLKNYIPTIMRPCYFSVNHSESPVYCSMQAPPMLETAPKSKNITSIIDNIRELRELIHYFSQETFDRCLKIESLSLSEVLQSLKFEFFHGQTFAYGDDIRPSTEIPEQDNNMLYIADRIKNRAFAESGPFVQGCVRIGVKKKDYFSEL